MKTRQVKMLAVGAVSLAALSPQTGRADNIAQVAMSAPDFSTLVTAVKAAGLAPALMGKGSLTVFAPTNAAFAKLPAGTVENLLKPENKATLVSILKYHVLPMRVSAKKVGHEKRRQCKNPEWGNACCADDAWCLPRSLYVGQSQSRENRYRGQ